MKPPSDWQNLVDLYPALQDVPADLRSLTERCEISTGDTLCRIGDQVQDIFLVIRGEVCLIRRGQDGREVVLQRAQSGFLAEASLTNKNYCCEVVVTKGGELIRFPAKAFREALDVDASFRTSWLARLASEVRKLRTQNERLSLHGAAERVIHYIESEGSDGSIFLNQSRKAWASELGLTHEALYRVLRRLQEDKTLHVDGKRISLTGKHQVYDR